MSVIKTFILPFFESTDHVNSSCIYTIFGISKVKTSFLRAYDAYRIRWLLLSAAAATTTAEENANDRKRISEYCHACYGLNYCKFKHIEIIVFVVV